MRGFSTTFEKRHRQYIRWVFVIMFFLSISLPSYCENQTDSLYSKKINGKFLTHHQKKAKGTATIAEEVSEYLENDFKYNPTHLFSWALKGLGLQNSDNEVIIKIISTSYDAKKNIISGVFDIEVPGFTTFRNVKIGAVVTRTKYSNGAVRVRTVIIYSGMLLKSACGMVTLVPLSNNEIQINTDSEIKLGWFFNIFVTQNRYKSIVEWRIQKMSNNIGEECTQRWTNINKANKR